MANTQTQDDLKALADSLAGTGSAMQAWVDAVQGDSEDSDLLGQLKSAVGHIEQAVGILKEGKSGPEAPASCSSIVVEGEPGLSGSPATVPVPDLLGFLAGSNRTGLLIVRGMEETFLFQFDRGEVIFAHGDSPPEGLRLGEVLLTMGHIHQGDLARALAEKDGPGENLGAILIRLGVVTQDQLEEALAYQARNVCERMFSLKEGTFEFYEHGLAIAREDIRLSVTSLLLEIARQIDESGSPASNWLDVPLDGEWDS